MNVVFTKDGQNCQHTGINDGWVLVIDIGGFPTSLNPKITSYPTKLLA